MTIRGADYPREPLDHYPTPREAVDVLFDNVELGPVIYDPACGPLKRIVRSAKRHGLLAAGHDVVNGHDFFDLKFLKGMDVVTNPPYGDRRGLMTLRFIEHALDVTEGHRCRVAMLLPIDFDSGKTRRHVFEHPAFALKLVLLDRIKWFNGKSGSTNHCWCVWSWKHRGAPIIRYARIDHD